jgi:phosphoglucomutase
VREKDGLWAVLLWLNILAERKETVEEILNAHWLAFGRNYYSRHDYEALPVDVAEAVMGRLRGRLSTLSGTVVQGMTVAAADDFAYSDPVDGSVSKGQGLRVSFTDGSRLVLRLSGTGTEGATLRLYLERYAAGPKGLAEEVQAALAPVIAAAEELAGIRAVTGRAEPDVVT